MPRTWSNSARSYSDRPATTSSQQVPEGKTAKNRVHLDVNAASRTAPGHSEEDWRQVEEHVRKLAAAGATVLREVNEVSGRCVVMQDPEGNEFCVH
ncbi:VOC family protein [Amycolatopsis sp.]|uniref:VOC family protein n=1 Tax=Amycolatopsis sp. TaxID=37632 RepID=UPI00261CE8A8|nr:VOC family protein [Amycolatopsis sp.]